MPRLMGTATLGQKRIKRRKKVIDLKCELLNRAKMLKGGKKKKSGISGELAIKSCTFVIARLGSTIADKSMSEVSI